MFVYQEAGIVISVGFITAEYSLLKPVSLYVPQIFHTQSKNQSQNLIINDNCTLAHSYNPRLTMHIHKSQIKQNESSFLFQLHQFSLIPVLRTERIILP